MTDVTEARLARLHEWRQKWQKILRLQDWDVDIEIVRCHALGNELALAECTVGPNKRAAVLRVADDRDERFDVFPKCKDDEVTVVHELLHIFTEQFAPVQKSDDGILDERETHMEQMVHAVSTAMVELDRKEGEAEIDRADPLNGMPKCLPGCTHLNHLPSYPLSDHVTNGSVARLDHSVP